MPEVEVVGRLAPTPSGDLHLGNACAFGLAWLSVRAQSGALLLRIEDNDPQRSSDAIAQRQRDDLAWLGLHWDHEVPPQSERDYEAALEQLGTRVYRCPCTRRAIRERGGHDPACALQGHREGAWRWRSPGQPQPFEDRVHGPQPGLVDGDDLLLRRRDGAVAYNLAVVVDDIRDGVTEVVRGADLLEATAPQIALCRALGGTPPRFMHAPLVTDRAGRKLSKRHGSLSIGAMREAGWSAADIWQLVLPWLGVPPQVPLHDAPAHLDPARVARTPRVIDPEAIRDRRARPPT